jgi:hypothetical protein
VSFSYTVDESTVFGNKRVVKGTYNCASVTTGDITTGLTSVNIFLMDTNTSSAVFRSTTSAGVTTITTNTSQTGNWIAIGE